MSRAAHYDRDAELAGRIRDPVRSAPVLSHIFTIDCAAQQEYRNWLGKPIPVLGLKAQSADNPTPPSRRRTPWQAGVRAAYPDKRAVSAPGTILSSRM